MISLSCRGSNSTTLTLSFQFTVLALLLLLLLAEDFAAELPQLSVPLLDLLGLVRDFAVGVSLLLRGRGCAKRGTLCSRLLDLHVLVQVSREAKMSVSECRTADASTEGSMKKIATSVRISSDTVYSTDGCSVNNAPIHRIA